jgi:hypothetical protein
MQNPESGCVVIGGGACHFDSATWKCTCSIVFNSNQHQDLAQKYLLEGTDQSHLVEPIPVARMFQGLIASGFQQAMSTHGFAGILEGDTDMENDAYAMASANVLGQSLTAKQQNEMQLATGPVSPRAKLSDKGELVSELCDKKRETKKDKKPDTVDLTERISGHLRFHRNDLLRTPISISDEMFHLTSMSRDRLGQVINLDCDDEDSLSVNVKKRKDKIRKFLGKPSSRCV